MNRIKSGRRRKVNTGSVEIEYNNVLTSCAKESVELGQLEKSGKNSRGVKSDTVVAGNGKNSVKSGIIGENKRGVKRKTGDFVEPFPDLGKKGRSSDRSSKIRNVDRIIFGDDDLNTIDLREDDSEEEDTIAESVGELNRNKRYHIRSKKANQSVPLGVSDDKIDDKSEDRSFRKSVVNPKKRKGLSRRGDRNNNVDEISNTIDESDDDDVQIIDVNYGSIVNINSSSSGKRPSNKVVSNGNTPHYKGKNFLASSSQRRDSNGLLEEWESFGVSNQNVKRVPDKKRVKGKQEYVVITNSSEELSNSETISGSDSGDSSESLHDEEKESVNSDDVIPSDDDKDCEDDDDVFVVSPDTSSVGEDEKVDDHETISRPKKVSIEPGPVKGKSLEGDGSSSEGNRERDMTEDTSSVAARLRSRRRSEATKIGKNKMANKVEGTPSCPYTSSVGEDEEVDDHETISRPKKVFIEPGPVKGKSLEGDGSSSEGNHERDVTVDTSSVAARLRSRRRSEATKIEKNKMANKVKGTPSCPYTLIDDEINESSEEEDVGHRDEMACPEVRDNGKATCKDTKEKNTGNKDLGGPARNLRSSLKSVNKIAQLEKEDFDHEVRDIRKNVNKDTKEENKGKKKRGRPPKNGCSAKISVTKILVDSIWEKGDAQLEKIVSSEKNPPDGVMTLPLKFRFDDSDTELSATTDIETENLFEEMNYCMEVVNVGGSDSVMVDSVENIPSNTNMDSACDCLGGYDHHIILDEQIGLRCTVCHLVMKEINNILPDFYKHQGGRSESREEFYNMDYSDFDAIQIEEFTATNLPSLKHNVPVEGTVWNLVPGIMNGMYPHQIEGFEFIWKNIAGSIFVEKAKKSITNGVGSGCIISHAPGTGKTRLTIMFLKTYIQLNPDCRPLIIAPCSMLLTWEEEFRKWNMGIPFHNLNSTEYSGQESKLAVNLQKKDRRKGQDLDFTRLVKLFSWKTEKSVLGISYQLFEELANISVLIDRGRKEGKGKIKDNDTAGQIRKMLLLLPGLLVLDEGHIPRNRASQIWKALSEVQTERRIMLSGTPFQNNFEELLNTFCMVRPKFSDEIISQNPGNGIEKRRRIKSAAKGKWASMTNNIGKNDEQKLKDLKNMIGEFVHVYKGSILKEKLPGLRDFVVVLKPSNRQNTLIDFVANCKVAFLKKENLRSLIAVHPSLFSYDYSSDKETPVIPSDELKQIEFDPDQGVKTKFLLELIKLSLANKERVLIFSQFLDPLNFIMKQLRKKFHWAQGQEILYIGGEHSDKERQLSINKLNDPKSEARVCLASSKACSEGINLIGASRVVLLDVVWNPAITRQSISRAYRLGQKKVVHVYHLIAGNWEWKKYTKQAGKDRISDLVFSSKDGVRKPEITYSVAEDKILQDMVENMGNIFLKILNQPKEFDLIDTFDCGTVIAGAFLNTSSGVSEYSTELWTKYCII